MSKQKAPKHRWYTCVVFSTDEHDTSKVVKLEDTLYQQRFHMKHKTDDHARKWARYLATGLGVQFVRLSRRHCVLDDFYPKRGVITPLRPAPTIGAPKYKRGWQFLNGEKYICRVSKRDEYGKITKKVYRMRHGSEASACAWAEHLLSLPGTVHVKLTGVLGGKAGESRDFKRENS